MEPEYDLIVMAKDLTVGGCGVKLAEGQPLSSFCDDAWWKDYYLDEWLQVGHLRRLDPDAAAAPAAVPIIHEPSLPAEGGADDPVIVLSHGAEKLLAGWGRDRSELAGVAGTGAGGSLTVPDVKKALGLASN